MKNDLSFIAFMLIVLFFSQMASCDHLNIISKKLDVLIEQGKDAKEKNESKP